MEVTRKDIMPNVALTCLRTDKFKSGCLSVSLLTQLTAENAAKNAILPRVLRRGTTAHPDMDSLSAALDELYGARVEPIVRKKGEIQVIGFFSLLSDDAFVPGNSRVLEDMSELLCELLLFPNTRGGLFLPQYVDSEKQKLLDEIRGRINDKRSYSLTRLVELMCPCEDFAVDWLGTEAEAESINYQKLTRYYHELISASPVEVFYCGSAEPERVESAVKDALVTLPRGEPDLEMGTDIRMNIFENETRYFTESMDVTQGKLALGFRLGDYMDDPDTAVLRVLNAVYGGSVTSKLFMNVREKLSLCYYASSNINLHKGIMTVSSGIEFDKYEPALAEIFAQLDAVKRGDITDEELTAAKKYVASTLISAQDSPFALEDYYLSNLLLGLDCSPGELAAAAEAVTKDDIVAAASGIECDAVYFLKGTEELSDEY